MQQLIEEKGIRSLYHFTNVDNLDSISRYGLIPRSKLELGNIPFYYNDEYRYDGHLNAVCMSIEFPNYKMFYSLRCRHPDYNWAVLKIDPNVLVEFCCAYSWTNAADTTSSSIPIDARTGKGAFLELFQDRDGYPRRESLNIPKSYPTNPQAEVLVFDTIPCGYINAVIFDTDMLTEKYRKLLPDTFSFSTDSSIFKWRKDYSSWKCEACSNGNQTCLHGIF
jgi:hypothetical protein